MNEPFLPLPLPSPPEHGFGPILAGAFGTLTRTARTLVRRFRRIGRKQSDPRLAARCRPGGSRKSAVRFPVLPPVEF